MTGNEVVFVLFFFHLHYCILSFLFMILSSFIFCIDFGFCAISTLVDVAERKFCNMREKRWQSLLELIRLVVTMARI